MNFKRNESICLAKKRKKKKWSYRVEGTISDVSGAPLLGERQPPKVAQEVGVAVANDTSEGGHPPPLGLDG